MSTLGVLGRSSFRGDNPKDIVASLAVGASRNVATDFAVSVAATFDAHLTGVAFVYEPLAPLADGFPAEAMQSQRIENEKAAKAAVTHFEEEVRRTPISAQSRMLEVAVASAPNVFANIAWRFDVSVMGQPEPHKPALEQLIVDAALFDSGRPVLIVPYIQRTGLKLDRVMVGWDGSRAFPSAHSDSRLIGDL